MNKQFKLIKENNKYNFKKNGKLISDIWFDTATEFVDRCSIVKIDNKYNIITSDGIFVSKTWYDYISRCNIDNCFKVTLNEKYNLIDLNGNLRLNDWYIHIGRFFNDVTYIISENNKFNYINKDLNILSKKWFIYTAWFVFEKSEILKRGYYSIRIKDKEILVWFNGIYCDNNMSMLVSNDSNDWFELNINGELKYYLN